MIGEPEMLEVGRGLPSQSAQGGDVNANERKGLGDGVDIVAYE